MDEVRSKCKTNPSDDYVKTLRRGKDITQTKKKKCN